MSLDITSLEQLFKMSRDAVIGIDDGGVICFVNPTAMTQFSFRPGDKAAKHLPEYILSDRSPGFFSTVKLGGKSYNASVARQEGVTLMCIFQRKPTKAGENGLSRALWELGNELLTSRLAIDAIVGSADVTKDKKLGSYASALYRSYHRMLRLHNHLTLSDILDRDDDRRTFVVIDLCDFCGTLCRTVGEIALSMGIELRYSCPDVPLFAEGDEKLLEIMLLNLFSNSLLHSAAGDTIDVTLTRQGDRYVIAVADSGSGIQPERLAELVNGADHSSSSIPSADTGAGLGLSIVRGIAERHGGALLPESSETTGTCMRVLLPRPAPRDTQILRQPPVRYRTSGSNNILTELSVVLDKSFYTPKMLD